jgi:hypothetical protein
VSYSVPESVLAYVSVAIVDPFATVGRDVDGLPPLHREPYRTR